MKQDLTREELEEAAELIKTQSPSARWLASWSKHQSVWGVELSSGAEVIVKYLKRHKQAFAFDEKEVTRDDYTITTDPRGLALLAKYGLYHKPQRGELAERVSPRWRM